MIEAVLVIRNVKTGVTRAIEKKLTPKHYEMLSMKVGKIENGYLLSKIERV